MKKFLFILLLGITALLPRAASADACDDLRAQFEKNGGSELLTQLPQYCTEGEVYTKITTMLYSAIGVAAVIALIYGGYVYMTSRSNADQAKRGLNIIKWAIIGLAIVLVAAVIVDLVVKFLVEGNVV